MKKFKHNFIITVIIIIIGLIVLGHLEERHYAFNGMVQKITFDEPKHTPTITINGNRYKFVYNNRRLLDSIKVGDSVLKIKGEERIQIVSKKE